jgi:PAS domain S-box-containing protein
VLFGVRSTFDVDGSLTFHEFHEVIQRLDISTRRPGVQVIGAAHLVNAEDLDAYEAEVGGRVASAGLAYPEFAIHPDTGADHVLAIDYLEPQRLNERSFGFDLLSEPNRRDAALRARDSDQPAMSAPVTLVQETGTQRAFLVMLPLYTPGSATTTVEQRRAAFAGVVYAAFRTGDLLNGVLGDQSPSRLIVIDVAANQLLFGGNHPGAAATAMNADDQRVGVLEVAGRTWQIFVDDGEPVLPPYERAMPLIILGGGLFVVGLLTALLRSVLSARARAVQLALEMTGELNALTESASEGIVSIDDGGRVVAWNHGATEMFGYSADEVIGRPARDLVPIEFRERFDQAVATLFSPEPHNEDLGQSRHAAGLRRDGEVFPVEYSASRWSARSTSYVTGFLRDVTERIRADELVRESTNLLVGVLGAATEVSIIGTDLHGIIRVFSAGAERMLGYQAVELVDVRTPALLHDSDEVAQRARELGIAPGFGVFSAVAGFGVSETRRWTYIRKDRTRLPVELTITPRYCADGTVCGFIGVAIDITERVADNDRQQRLLDSEREMVSKLTEVDRVKNDFVSTMSHELRTPLTSIIGYSELLTDGLESADPSPQTAMVDMIAKNAERLLLLVEDLLELSQIEAGAHRAAMEPCDITKVLRSAIASIEPIAASRSITVRTHASRLPMVRGNAVQLERVFLNLLSNAVKFSHDGGDIEVTAASGDQVTVRVADHGIGIPADEQDKVFARFFRSRLAEARAIQGTGLGLAIVANIVERHGGTIAISSGENVGTEVTVSLPAHIHPLEQQLRAAPNEPVIATSPRSKHPEESLA